MASAQAAAGTERRLAEPHWRNTSAMPQQAAANQPHDVRCWWSMSHPEIGAADMLAIDARLCIKPSATPRSASGTTCVTMLVKLGRKTELPSDDSATATKSGPSGST